MSEPGMTALEVLEKARALIAPPGKWCKDTNARDAQGRAVRAHSSNAAQWCAHGAVFNIRALYGVVATPAPIRMLNRAAGRLFSGRRPATVAEVNDIEGKDAVLGVYDEAIRVARARVAAALEDPKEQA